MVTLRGIILSAVIALSLFGACRDIPIDDDSAHVIIKDDDSTKTPQRDSCPDCVGHKRPSVRLMRVHYYKGYNKWDSLSVNLLDTSQVCSMDSDPLPGGGMKLKLHIEASIPFLGFGSTYDYWGVRDMVVNLPEIVIDGQGRCNPIDLRSDPLENDNRAGISLPYRYNYTGKYGQFYDVIKVATGERNHGTFRVTGVDPGGRFVDARLEATFHFPDTPFVFQNVFYSQPQPYGTWKKEKVEEVDLILSFRLALNP
jgi:hypothetical protein